MLGTDGTVVMLTTVILENPEFDPRYRRFLAFVMYNGIILTSTRLRRVGSVFEVVMPAQ
jgi:hypothetical protein